jgi:hypothetical protein
MVRIIAVACILAAWGPSVLPAADDTPRIGFFECDASPPVGSPLAYDPNREVEVPLSCRGVVLSFPVRDGLAQRQPIVLCAIDWIGIGNGGYAAFRRTLAEAAGTDENRVSMHTLHQHDAPWCDFTADELLSRHQIAYRPFDTPFARDVLKRLHESVKHAVAQTQPFTHVGLSTAEVNQVASSRRILGPDGKVAYVRYTATKDPKIRAFPEGTIDPLLRMITFWNEDRPLIALTYYATHPQSYYRTGKANPDFPGLARNARQQQTGVPHVHVNGAGGNVGAGKYNDGAPENRKVLADRVADAMQRAWTSTKKHRITASDIRWRTTPVALPPSSNLDANALEAKLNDTSATAHDRFIAATKLAWLRRALAKETIDLACLSIGDARILHMPGELFVEYQLEAQRLRPDLFVAMAAYGDYGPSYIGTAIAYAQGGYETQPDSSFVAPAVETELMQGIAELLEVPPTKLRPLR